MISYVKYIHLHIFEALDITFFLYSTISIFLYMSVDQISALYPYLYPFFKDMDMQFSYPNDIYI